jgi:hypothetical protein
LACQRDCARGLVGDLVRAPDVVVGQPVGGAAVEVQRADSFAA